MGKRTDRIKTDVTPQLQPNIPADRISDRRIEIGRSQGMAQGDNAWRATSVWFANGEAVEFMVLDNARCDDFTGCIDDTADSAFRPNQVPLPSARVDRLQMMALVRPACLVEVPPWNAVHRGDQCSIRSKQRLDQCRAFMSLVRFQGTNHEFLLSEIGRVIACGQSRHFLAPSNQQFQSIPANRFKMRAPRHNTDLMSCQCQLHCQISTNRPGAENAYLHVPSSPKEFSTGYLQRLHPYKQRRTKAGCPWPHYVR